MLPPELSKQEIAGNSENQGKHYVLLNKLKEVTRKKSTREGITQFVNLFECKRLRGFWPCYSQIGGSQIVPAVSGPICLKYIEIACIELFLGRNSEKLKY